MRPPRPKPPSYLDPRHPAVRPPPALLPKEEAKPVENEPAKHPDGYSAPGAGPDRDGTKFFQTGPLSLDRSLGWLLKNELPPVGLSFVTQLLAGH